MITRKSLIVRLFLTLIVASLVFSPFNFDGNKAFASIPTNYVTNGGFETGDLTGWSTTSNIDLDNGVKRYGVYAEAGGYLSPFRLSLWSDVAYKVTTSQVISLPNGIYALTAKVKNSGGQNRIYLFAKNYGGAELQANISEIQGWTTITIQGINVMNGQCEIGIYSDSPAGKWTNLDNVKLVLGDGSEPSDLDETPIPELDLGAYYEIVNHNSEMALNHTGTSTFDQAAFAFGGVDSQKWQLIYAGYGYMKIKNKLNNNLLTSTSGQLESIAEAPADDGQLWQLIDAGGGYYQITNKESGKVMDLTGGQIIEAASDSSSNTQQWNFVKVGMAPFIIGTDPSYLEEYEPLGTKYYEDGIEKDALEIYQNNGFTYARIRVWNDPENGWYNKDHTIALAKRCYALGYELMIDFHYSDTWGDASHQHAPAAWAGMTFEQVNEALITYTKDVLSSLEEEGISVDMVQIGNEINTGMVWPFGEVDHGDNPDNWDNFATLLKSGIQAAKDVFPYIKTIIQSNTGTDNAGNRYFYDNLISRDVNPDILGFSYYTSWNGTLQELYHNLNDMVSRYDLPVMIVENAQPWKEGGFYKGSDDYPLTVEGQTQFYKDLLRTARSVKNGMCLGVVQWGTDGILPPGNSQWNTGTLFDYDGNALSSIDVFQNNTDAQSIKVTAVTLNKNSLDLAVRSSASVTTTITPVNAGNQAVLWSSDNKSVAKVDALGQVTAVSQGVAHITVTTVDGRLTDIITVTVLNPDATLSDIQIDGHSITNFDSAIKSYDIYLLAELGSEHTVSATATNPSAQVEVTQATDFPGQATIAVTSPDETTTYTYIVNLEQLGIASLQNPFDVTTEAGIAPVLPQTIVASYNDGTAAPVNVTWANIDANLYASAGDFIVHGTVEGTPIVPEVKVIVAHKEYIINPGFESGMNHWTVTSNSNTQDSAYLGMASDSHTGSGVLNYWNGSKFDFTISQQITGLENGKYKLTAWTRGSGGENTSRLFATPGGGETLTVQYSNNAVWMKQTLSNILVTDGTVTIGAEINAKAGNWGFIDDFELLQISKAGSDATLSDLTVNGTTINGFAPDITDYDMELPVGTTQIPAVGAVAADTQNAAVVITQSLALPGQATVVVTAGTSQKTYIIHFTVDIEPSVYPDDANITYVGRWDRSNSSVYHSYWGGAYFNVNFTGTTIKVKLASPVSLAVNIDGTGEVYYNNVSGTVNLTPTALAAGTHTLRIAAKDKDDEIMFKGLLLDSDAASAAPKTKQIIEFAGDSITAGDRTTKGYSSAYPWLLADHLGYDHTQIAYPGIALVDGYHYTSSSSPIEGLSKQYFKMKGPSLVDSKSNDPNTDWDFANYAADKVVVNIGTNDHYLNVSAATFQRTYLTFLQGIREKYANADIYAMRPFGGFYEMSIQRVVVQMNNAGDSKVHYVNTTGWLSADDFADGTHPTDAGHVKAAGYLQDVISGAAVPIAVTGVAFDGDSATVEVGKAVQIQATVKPDRASLNGVAYVSSNPSVAKVDPVSGIVIGVAAGKATITATTYDGAFIATCEVTVTPRTNFINNPGIEEGLDSWTISDSSVFYQTDSGHTGNHSLAYYKATAFKAEAYQTLTGLQNGIYTLSAWSQGAGKETTNQLYAISGQNIKLTADFTNTGWAKWSEAKIDNIQVTDGTLKVGVYLDANDDDWGSFDDFELIKVADPSPNPDPNPKQEPMPVPITTPKASVVKNGKTTVISVAVTATNDPVTGNVNAKVGADTAIALVNKVKEAEASGQKAVIEIKVESAAHTKSVVVEVQKDALQQMVDNTKAALKIVAGIGTITFDAKAVGSLNNSATAEGISISIKRIEKAALTQEDQEKVGDRPVYDFSVMAGDTPITKFNGGKAEIEIPYAPKAGEKDNAIVIYYIDDAGELINVRGNYDSASGTVRFITDHLSKYAVGYHEVNFSDVAENAWYGEAVGFMSARGIVRGIGDGQFEPGRNVTRADFLIMVMNAYGIELDTSVTDNYSDAGNKYYTNYLGTAKRLGLVTGVGDNYYAPEAFISRQDMFTLLHRALDQLGELPTSTNGRSLDNYKDSSDISNYAQNAMKVFVEAGTIAGDGKNLAPKATSTRAQAVQVLFNLLSK